MNHSSYYGDESLLKKDYFDEKKSALEVLFGNNVFSSGDWNYFDIDRDKFGFDEFLIIEAEKGSAKKDELKSVQEETTLKPEEISEWENDF